MAEKTKKEKSKKSETQQKRVFRLKHVFMIILMLLLLLALFSHNAKDLDILAGGVDEPLMNWIGPAGANTAMVLVYMLGVAAYPVVILLVICALRPLLPIPVNRKGYIGALIAVIAGIVQLFAMWPSHFCEITENLGIGHSAAPESALSGGVLGQKIAAPADSAAANHRSAPPGLTWCPTLQDCRFR